jgi:hypothetical protein
VFVSCSSKDAPQTDGAELRVLEKSAANEYGIDVGTKLPDNLAEAVSAVSGGGVPQQTGLAVDGPVGGGIAIGGGVPKKVDEDLTALNGTMLFAKIYDMTANPNGYMGKVVKMKGAYVPSFDSETGARYHYVMVSDVASCCKQGLEFIWSGKHAYPADYPEENTKIEVAGVFGSYEEQGTPYYYLAIDNIAIKK